MASWLERGRPALLEALNSVCDRIDDDLRAELQRQEQIRAIGAGREKESARRQALRCHELEQENELLRTHLARLHHLDTSRHSPRLDPDKATKSNDQQEGTDGKGHGAYPLSELTPGPTDSKPKLFRNNQILVKKFQALDANYKKLLARYGKTRKIVEARETSIASLEQKVVSLESRLDKPSPLVTTGPPPNVSLPKLSRASSHDPPSSASHDPAAGLSFSSEPGADLAGEAVLPPHLPPPQRQSRDAPASDIFNRSTSPASDEDAAETTALPPLQAGTSDTVLAHIKAEPSSDPVVVVSERQVKKRKNLHDPPEESPERRRMIKLEDSDSTPRIPSQGVAATVILHEESIDLDEVGPRLSTPRKLRLWREGLEAGLPAAIRSGDLAPIASQVRTPTTEGMRRTIESSALTPIDVNVMANRTSKAAKSVDNRPRKNGVSEGIRSLAEDGNLYRRAVRRKTNNALLETPAGDGRLDRLLNARSPEREPAIIRSAPGLRTARRVEADDFIPQRRVLPFGENKRDKAASEETPSRQRTTKHAEKPLQKRAPEAAQRDSGEDHNIRGSLRTKDPSTMQLADFKVNPKVNDGSDFAYSEVVRGKENRACLSGCTDEHCCGPMFRQLAIIEARKRQPSEDTALFEDYLGDSISRIWSMSKEEKDELWIEAKAWQLANLHGKHRHRHARRASPPGFWNADFPSTQEIENEKVEAARREKQMVQDRYREAMRPNGRWIFRDE